MQTCSWNIYIAAYSGLFDIIILLYHSVKNTYDTFFTH